MIGIDRSKMKLYDVAEDASVLNQTEDDENNQQFTETQNRLSKFDECNV